MEYHELIKMSRVKLEEKAIELGVSDPSQFSNKGELAKAIAMIEDSTPEQHITVDGLKKHMEENPPAPTEIDDDGLVLVVVTGSHFGYDSKIYKLGDTLRVPPEVEQMNRLISIPVAPEIQEVVDRLKKENMELRREAGK